MTNNPFDDEQSIFREPSDWLRGFWGQPLMWNIRRPALTVFNLRPEPWQADLMQQIHSEEEGKRYIQQTFYRLYGESEEPSLISNKVEELFRQKIAEQLMIPSHLFEAQESSTMSALKSTDERLRENGFTLADMTNLLRKYLELKEKDPLKNIPEHWICVIPPNLLQHVRDIAGTRSISELMRREVWVEPTRTGNIEYCSPIMAYYLYRKPKPRRNFQRRSQYSRQPVLLGAFQYE